MIAFLFVVGAALTDEPDYDAIAKAGIRTLEGKILASEERLTELRKTKDTQKIQETERFITAMKRLRWDRQAGFDPSSLLVATGGLKDVPTFEIGQFGNPRSFCLEKYLEEFASTGLASMGLAVRAEVIDVLDNDKALVQLFLSNDDLSDRQDLSFAVLIGVDSAYQDVGKVLLVNWVYVVGTRDHESRNGIQTIYDLRLGYESRMRKALAAIELPEKQLRIWRDISGVYSVTASLVDMQNEKVSLLKSDGQKIEVPVAKLSAQDLEFVTKALGVQ